MPGGRWRWCGACGSHAAARDDGAALTRAPGGRLLRAAAGVASGEARGRAFLPADHGDELLLTWLAHERVAAGVSAAAPRLALVRLSTEESSRLLQRWDERDE